MLYTVFINMRKKVIEALERKEAKLQEVFKLYNEYNNGSKEHTLNDINNLVCEINAQISILRHLLSK